MQSVPAALPGEAFLSVAAITRGSGFDLEPSAGGAHARSWQGWADALIEPSACNANYGFVVAEHRSHTLPKRACIQLLRARRRLKPRLPTANLVSWRFSVGSSNAALMVDWPGDGGH